MRDKRIRVGGKMIRVEDRKITGVERMMIGEDKKINERQID